MPTEIHVPALGESVSEATVGQWFKKPGDAVAVDEPLVELETDKVTIEVPAPIGGVLSEIMVEEGGTVAVGALLGAIAEGEAAPAAKAEAETAPAPQPAAPAEPRPAAPVEPPAPAASVGRSEDELSPAVRKLVDEQDLDTSRIQGTGKDGRILKGDVLRVLEGGAAAAPAPEPVLEPPETVRVPSVQTDEAREERVRMSKLRQTIAQRLKDAQNTAAMLTTFNEVDMSAVMDLRAQYKDLFERKHAVKLGFMGFFVKACVHALKEVPAVNAEIDGTDIIYKNYYHIGIAVGTDRGLVVPVVREADHLDIAELEMAINDFGARARSGNLGIEEMQGGTFTITNGGIYGSLMSTPILNAPQSGILGMHKIEQRPVVIDGEITVRPMMYLALSYDHRIVDGKDAVTFLVRVKESLEEPQRLFLDL